MFQLPQSKALYIKKPSMEETSNINRSSANIIILVVLIGIPFKLFLMEPYGELADENPIALFSAQSLLFIGLISYVGHGVFKNKDYSMVIGLVICSVILGYSLWEVVCAITNV